MTWTSIYIEAIANDARRAESSELLIFVILVAFSWKGFAAHAAALEEPRSSSRSHLTKRAKLARLLLLMGMYSLTASRRV
jgi:hypothetical protein